MVEEAAKAKLKQYENAISDYDAALSIKPDYFAAYCERGAVKTLQGQYEAAIADFDAALRIKPDAEVYFIRGSAKHVLGRSEEAEDDLQTALELAEQGGDQRLKNVIEQFIQKFEVGNNPNR